MLSWIFFLSWVRPRSVFVLLLILLCFAVNIKGAVAEETGGILKRRSLFSRSSSGPAATTKTEISPVEPLSLVLSPESYERLQEAEARYETIVANGDWPKVPVKKMRKGDEGREVALLNQRLFIEGYVRREAVSAAHIRNFTNLTQEALVRYQYNHGLAVTGQLDKPTAGALNISAAERLAMILANLPRLKEYEKGLGARYIVVNVPAAQLQSVNDGLVYSQHNVIVGRPERPTPVVMAPVSNVAFNPYWNAPSSIAERDIVPRIVRGNTKYLSSMNIRVFKINGGKNVEINPNDVDWSSAIVDNYLFREEPGPRNAMASAKINFQSPFGIYLHDTPDKDLFARAQRFYSSGCIRVEKVSALIGWILRGQDGFDDGKIEGMKQTLEQREVPVIAPPQLRVVYLTAWANERGEVNFRNDIYDLDISGYVTGQPMPLGQLSSDGQRYVLKPIPRTAAAVDAAEADVFFTE